MKLRLEHELTVRISRFSHDVGNVHQGDGAIRSILFVPILQCFHHTFLISLSAG